MHHLGLLQAMLQQDSKAEAWLLKALQIEPFNREYLYAVAEFYARRGRVRAAKPFAETLVSHHPEWTTGSELLDAINKILAETPSEPER